MSHEKARHIDGETLHTQTIEPAPGEISATASASRSVSEMVLIEEGNTLTTAQRRTARDLLRLYESLCGGQPGQYWPQALLDSAGGFTRPPFPARSFPSGEGR